MVHKRIGVEPKLYLTAVQILLKLLEDLVISAIHDPEEQLKTINSLHKIIMFDMTFIFDTYIRSLLMEVKVSREKLSLYASELERKVRTRTIQLEQLSRTDPLTGLLNKRHMEEILTTALRAAQRRNEPVTLVYIDINDFKIVNDTQGHQRGDEILVAVAKILKESSRSEDFCFRYGGDEFCVIMANCLMDHARTVWESRVTDLLLTHKEVETSLSIGYAQTGPEKYISAEELVFLADARMYEEKKRMKES
jgi:diguanylate cyclase (GGDEF)-like protein